ncbi:MAG: dihydrolipoyl dehydrogenase [Legionellales bacterium]|nr:dihydrolipoyl dehydrogenase [Legionellales bacterium]|tara:strand:- start:397 stop:1812 length:1416 start_codon:yes stop_codon:yes gene_type:complete
MDTKDQLQVHTVVIGSGPSGYAAAFRLADLLGQSERVAMVEQYGHGKMAVLGGVCLNEGCIPSKTYLHMAEVINETKALSKHGLSFGKVKLSKSKILKYKQSVVAKLNKGIAALANKRHVEVVHGTAEFIDTHHLRVGETQIEFKQAIIATGSQPISLPFMPKDDRIIDSTQALELPTMEGKLLVIGGGIIGCEMATVYQAFGMDVTVVEMCDQIMPGADPDLAKPCQKMMESRGISIQLESTLKQVSVVDKQLVATVQSKDGSESDEQYDLILQAIGRKPNSNHINLEAVNIDVDAKGFIVVDGSYRTNHQHIYAVGDVVGDPMLAHKGTAEGRLVAEIIAGKRLKFDATIPSVAYTDPEVAWVGYTEIQAKANNIPYRVAKFPWAACGRAICLDRTEGFTKLLVNTDNNRIIGAGIVGVTAGDLIAELALAIEMGCDIEDIALTIHPHPTLSETVGLTAEVYEGTVTDL